MEALNTYQTVDSPVRTERLPWFVFLFLAVLFFAMFHNPTRAVTYHDEAALQKELKDATRQQTNISTNIAEGSVTRRIGFMVLGLFGLAVLLFKERGSISVTGGMGVVLLFLLTWIAFSIFWTEDAGMTFRRLVVLTMVLCGALALAVGYSLREIMWFLFVCTGIYLFTGIVAEVAVGNLTPWVREYQFSGTLHPNQQGDNCAILFLSACYLYKTEKRHRNWFLAAAMIGLMFLGLTKSRTALAAALGGLTVAWTLSSSLSRRLVLVINVGLVLALLVVMVGQEYVPALKRGILLGRETDTAATLTGRLPVWQECLRLAANHPWLGYGFGAFWTPKRAIEFTAGQGWAVGEAHSAYLEMILSLGLVGLITFVTLLVLGVIRSFSYFRKSLDPKYAFVGALLTFAALNGLLESSGAAAAAVNFLNFTVFVLFLRLAFSRPAFLREELIPDD